MSWAVVHTIDKMNKEVSEIMETKKDYKFANLSNSEVDKLQETERKLKTEAGREIIVLAYTKE